LIAKSTEREGMKLDNRQTVEAKESEWSRRKVNRSRVKSVSREKEKWR